MMKRLDLSSYVCTVCHEALHVGFESWQCACPGMFVNVYEYDGGAPILPVQWQKPRHQIDVTRYESNIVIELLDGDGDSFKPARTLVLPDTQIENLIRELQATL